MTTSSLIALENRYSAHNYDPLPVVLAKGKGVWLWDTDGKRYLDMMSAYSAVSLGHSHPRLLAVLNEQAQRLCVTSRAFHNEVLPVFLEQLCTLTGMDKALPMNTGVEAVETAIKAARRFGYEKKGIPLDKAEIIVASNNFHGRTVTVISFSSEPDYKQGFGPFTPGFVTIPFGKTDALSKAITPYTCAVIIEPMQGEAGICLPPAGWLKACQRYCERHNVLFILDEVQTGLGRTGKWFAGEHENIKADGIILGKALGGGILPVSAFLGKSALMAGFTPGSHGSTFGGNPLASRMGLEVLTLLKEEDCIAQSASLGKVLLEGLQSLKHPLIKEVRGKGLWVGVELVGVSARLVCEKLMEKGILTKDVYDRVIRFAPPLIIERDCIDWTIEQFAQTLKLFE